MNKREILEKIIRQGGVCKGVSCTRCPLENHRCGGDTFQEVLAEAQKLLSEMEVTLKTNGLDLLSAVRAVEEGKAEGYKRPMGYRDTVRKGERVDFSPEDILATDYVLVDPKVSTEEVIEKTLREWQPANRTFLPATIAQALRAAGKLREGE